MSYRDNRYVPRDRSPRFGDRRPFSNRPPSPTARDSRDAPRGPKLTDAVRDGPGTPSGPRRGGFGSRGDFRELRDAPPLGDGARRTWRDGRDGDFDYDRRDRDRRSPPRGRSPPRARRDSRERPYTNDLDIPRARRNSRDGPPSAGSNLSDAPRGFSSSIRGLARGRGRGTWDYRDRGRPYGDDRDRDGAFRARSRSPRPRLERDLSRDRRDYDRRDERREDERRFSIRDDRDLDRFRRDGAPSRTESRHPSGSSEHKPFGDGSEPNTPHPLSAASHADRGGNADSTSRRGSTALDPAAAKEARRDLEKGEIPTARTEPSRDRFVPRPSSPTSSGPQVPPQVPAFGGNIFGRPGGPTSNVWRAPQLQSRPSFGASTATAPAASLAAAAKPPPAGPRAQTAAAPPTGPKAERTQEPPKGPASDISVPVQSEKKEPTPDEKPTISSRLGPATSAAYESKPVTSAETTAPTFDVEPPKGPRMQSATTTSTAPASRVVPPVQPAAFQKSPQAPKANIPVSAPSGPRAGTGPSVSPPGMSANVPTGPRAERDNRLPPSAPRANIAGLFGSERAPPRGPAIRNPQWVRQGAPAYGRPSMIPAKRDLAGDEKPNMANIRRSPVFERSFSYNELAASKPAIVPTARSEPDDEMTSRRPWGSTQGNETIAKIESKEDVDMAEADEMSPSVASATARSTTKALPEPSSDSSDDDEELMGDMLADIHAKHDRQQAAVAARLIDLSQSKYRATSPFRRIAILDALTAADVPFKASAEATVSSPTISTGPVASSTTPLPSIERPTADMLTPKDEDVAMGETSPAPRKIIRVIPRERIPRSPTPELTALPFLIKGPPTPVSDPEQTRDSLSKDIMEGIEAEMKNHYASLDEHHDNLLEEYRKRYLVWRKHALALERREREEIEAKERAEREKLVGKTPEPDAAAAVAANLPLPTPTEGRRSHRFASQLDFDLAIQASLETAKEDAAKQEREAQHVQPDYEKEAEIPNMLSEREIQVRMFRDTNQARVAARAIEFYDFVPPVDDFTPEEHDILVAGYKADPKAWGKIAQSLPGRTFKDCINHYYSTKWTTDYKSLKDRRRRANRRKNAMRGARSALTGLGEKDGEDGTPAVTETGRPRRQAAPTFGEKEVDNDLASATAKKLAMGEQTAERATKRQKGSAKGEGRRKKGAQAQPLVARPTLSPTKVDKDRKERGPTAEPHDIMRDGIERWPGIPGVDDKLNGYAALTGRPELGFERLPADVAPSIEKDRVIENPRARGGTQTQRAGASSYWSVQEQTDFKRYVSYYGSDFQKISQLMGTKTHIMVCF